MIYHQPAIDGITGSVLCWNGEAWRIESKVVTENDTAIVFAAILAASRTAAHSKECEQSKDTDLHNSITKMLAMIKGPFAFVYFDATSSSLYYGRDHLGRRSLLIRSDANGFTLTSTSDGAAGWQEVPADGIYMEEFQSGLTPRLVSWKSVGIVPPFNRDLPPAPLSVSLHLESPSVVRLENLLRSALQFRVLGIPAAVVGRQSKGSEVERPDSPANKQQMKSIPIPVEMQQHSPSHCARLAILFSGGLDCTVLARLAHDLLPSEDSIDLLNVAFENPRNPSYSGHLGRNVYEICPDRITGRASAKVLEDVCPGRVWRFIEIDVPYLEMQAHRETVVSLMYPHDTEMDLSIALALYFASRGTGYIQNGEGATTGYTSSARVLLSGLGADELFGGYQRHKTAFQRRGHAGLLDELELDISRLGKRNLGRDDRVIAHWGKEARYAYLDEDLVRWALATPVWEKCGFGQGDIDLEPDKLALRLLAKKLGMQSVAREKKRAIQFGARTAKLERKTAGTAQISPRMKIN